ncbi:MAG: TldD/PmbA family protein [Gammaproteobacteria bacterium]|nr:TldD/PmbA family protein [Gammaproteobacteria bacterium]
MAATHLETFSGVDYAETRQHEVRIKRLVMVDGNLTANSETHAAGTSSRVFNHGYWGFASVPDLDKASIDKTGKKAAENALAMGRFGQKPRIELPTDNYSGEQVHAGKTKLSQKDCVDFLKELHDLCRRKFPGLKSTSFMMMEESHSKRLATSNKSQSYATIDRGVFYIDMADEDQHGQPLKLMQPFSAKGSLADLRLSASGLEVQLEEMYRHLQAKKVAVPARGGEKTVVLSPELAGMLAHEAMGHPCEADIVLGGAVTGRLVGEKIASDLITMVDFAHSYAGQELMVPVYVDDEGSESRDAMLIEKGVLKSFMTSRETAARLNIPSTGSARAYAFNDEPLVRMRNTAILPGESKLEDMIAGVEDGYYLMKTGNGQADTTSEFMFGITLAYEIRNGKLGSAITDTTVSGTAINMLKTVDAVSDDMHWECNGYCGKKQPMVVSLGGPALRARVHVGGQ